MILHRLFLAVWLFDFVVIPVLAVLQLGYSVPITSNYFARFSYIGALMVAVLYHVLMRRRLVMPAVSLAFVAIAVVGGTKGLLLEHFNREYVAHVFYCAMPIVMVSYGWHFMKAYQESVGLRRDLKLLMLAAFYVGIAAGGAFVAGARLGLASYDALGLWNFFFAGPFLAFQGSGSAYFAVAILGAVFTAKRSTLGVFVVYAGLYLAWLKRSRRRVVWLAAPMAVAVAVLLLGDSRALMESRVARSVAYLQKGDLDGATANRWAESAAAIAFLRERTERVVFGAGFGARFKPWPDKPDYRNYYQHYTHFGVVSYVWFGGVFAPLLVYATLSFAAFRLFLKARRRDLRRQDYVFPMWFIGILTVSLFGAVLMNNSFLWFVIGACLRLDAATAPRTA